MTHPFSGSATRGLCALVLAALLPAPSASAQATLLTGDHSVRGNLCVGTSCNASVTFPDNADLLFQDTVLRTYFQDVEGFAGHAENDWEFVFNDTGFGGQNYFALRDVDANGQVFRVQSGAPANAFFMAADGKVGLGTSIPVQDLHVTSPLAPSVRLEKTSAGGGAPYTWDIVAHDRAFIIRNVTGNSSPFLIGAEAPYYSLFVENTGNIGIGTGMPEERLHIRSDAANTDAFALFDANAAGSDAAFLLRQNGTIPTTWEFRNQETSGRLNVGIAGGNTPFKIDNLAANNLLKLGINGNPNAVVVTGQLRVNNTQLNVPDYVFGDDYALRPLSEVQAFIDENSHLPEVPSEADIKANGVDMTEMQMTLLKKVEELTLYTLEQQNIIVAERARNDRLDARLARLEAQASE